MKTCEYYEELISRLLDGELSPEEETELWEHIAQCPRCAEACETYRQMTAALRSDLAEPPAALSRLVMARIAGQTAPAPEAEEKRRGSVHRLRPWGKVAAAACFVALVAAGAVTGVFSRGARLYGTAGNSAAQDTNGTAYRLTEVLPAADAGAGEAAARSAPGSQPEPESAPAAQEQTEKDAAPAGGPALFSAADGVMTIMEPLPTADGQVLDAAGRSLGHVEDAGALAALLTGEPWTGADPETVYTLALDGAAYTFGADETGALLWRQDGQEGFTLSPASLSDLEALIRTD